MHYDENNIFAKIIKKELPASIIFENDYTMVIEDKYPKADIHWLVLPKAPYVDLVDFYTNGSVEEISSFFSVLVAHLEKLPGAKVIFNYREEGGQEIFHLHAHILGGQFDLG
jgi:histidine triad (HIT) family protein